MTPASPLVLATTIRHTSTGAVLYPIYLPGSLAHGASYAYNLWTGGWAAGRSVYGPYGAAGSSAWYNSATGHFVAGDNGAVVKGPNSVYAGSDGYVYRKDSSGGWSKRDNGTLNPVDSSAAKQQAQ